MSRAYNTVRREAGDQGEHAGLDSGDHIECDRGASTGAGRSQSKFVRAAGRFGPAPVRVVATIEIDGASLQLQCSEAQRVTEVAVTPRDAAWALRLEMTTPMGIRTVLRNGAEWPLRLSTSSMIASASSICTNA